MSDTANAAVEDVEKKLEGVSIDEKTTPSNNEEKVRKQVRAFHQKIRFKIKFLAHSYCRTHPPLGRGTESEACSHHWTPGESEMVLGSSPLRIHFPR